MKDNPSNWPELWFESWLKVVAMFDSGLDMNFRATFIGSEPSYRAPDSFRIRLASLMVGEGGIGRDWEETGGLPRPNH